MPVWGFSSLLFTHSSVSVLQLRWPEDFSFAVWRRRGSLNHVCRKENQQLQGHGPQLEMGGVPALIRDESLPRVEDLKYLEVFSHVMEEQSTRSTDGLMRTPNREP